MKDCPSQFALSLPLLYRQIFAGSLAFVTIFVFLSNATLIYLLHKTKQMAPMTSKLVILLTISDLCAGFISYPCIIAVYSSPSDSRICNFELVTQFIALFFGYLSFCILMSIAVDRYIHVTKLQRYNVYMNDFTLKLMLLFSVVCSVVLACISTLYSSSFFAKVAISSVNAFSLSSVCIFYLLVDKRIRIHVENAGKDQRAKNRQLLASIKTVRILLWILLIAYLPYTVMSCVWAYYKMYRNKNPGFLLDMLKTASYLLTFSNAWINAVVYCYGNKKLWNYVRQRNTVKPSTDTGYQ